MRVRSLALALYLCFPAAVHATPEEDAQRIVDALVTEDMGKAIAQVQHALLSQMFAPVFDRGNATPEERSRFLEIFIAELVTEYEREINDLTVALYLEEFSPEDLESIAAFLESGVGRTWISKMPTMTTRAVEAAQVMGPLIAQAALPRVEKRLRGEGLMDVPAIAEIMSRSGR